MWLLKKEFYPINIDNTMFIYEYESKETHFVIFFVCILLVLTYIYDLSDY